MYEYVILHSNLLLPGDKHAFDRKVIRDRFKAEGIGFSNALEALAEHLMVSLDQRRWVPISHFARRKDSVLPRFLGSSLNVIFDDEGEITCCNETAAKAVRLVLQVCLLFKKFEADPTNEMVESALESFRSVQKALEADSESGRFHSLRWDCWLNGSFTQKVRSVVHELWDDLILEDGSYGPGSNLLGIDPQTLTERCPNPNTFPKGSPAYNLLGNIVDSYFTPCEVDSEPTLPFEYYALKARSVQLDTLSSFRSTYGNRSLDSMAVRESFYHDSSREYGYCKLLAVAKNRKKARLIGKMHPDHVYVQLALDSAFKKRVSQNTFWKHALPFSDQSIPSDKAVASSLSGDWATIDLSAASDWLSWEVVKFLFPKSILDIVAHTRAEYALIGEERVPVFSYGQMGDGTTFAFLSTVCAAIALVACEECGYDTSNPYSPPFIVYGDDIQVPVEVVPTLLDALERFGFRINRSKSFFTPGGLFRESCNGWGAFGYPVKPVWHRKKASSGDYESIHSHLSCARLLDKRGFTGSAHQLYAEIESVLGFVMPPARDDDAHFGRYSRASSSTRVECLKLGLKKWPVWRTRQLEFQRSLVADVHTSISQSTKVKNVYREKTRFLRTLSGFRMVRVPVDLPSSLYVSPFVQLALPLGDPLPLQRFDRGDVVFDVSVLAEL